MEIRSPAIVCAVRPHGETAVIARFLTADHGLVAGYVAGGRGRDLRPVVIPGNRVALDLRARSHGQLAFAKPELLESCGPWLGEPLPAAALGWATALTAATLPERNAYPSLYEALDALLNAICHAPSARGWTGVLLGYEALLLRELGYGGSLPPIERDWSMQMDAFARMGNRIERYLLADHRQDVMAARERLRARLVRIGPDSDKTTGRQTGQ
ncbi:MAG: DNA repair protein RecO [Novosphingobium sp.]